MTMAMGMMARVRNAARRRATHAYPSAPALATATPFTSLISPPSVSLQSSLRRGFVSISSPQNRRPEHDDDDDDDHNNSSNGGGGLSAWREHVQTLGAEYMAQRAIGIASRLFYGAGDFLLYNHHHQVFARQTANDARYTMFALTRALPRAVQLDLAAFQQGATQAVHAVYDELYRHDAFESVASDALRTMVSDSCLPTLQRKPRALRRRLALHSEPRHTRTVLEQLDIDHLGLLAVQYTSMPIAPSANDDNDENKNTYKEEGKEERVEELEALCIDVHCRVTEHVRVGPVVSPLATATAIESFETFHSAFTWRFESSVNDPARLDWTITQVSGFDESSAIMRRAYDGYDP